MNDVINQVKEAFLDENIDVDVLYQLKKVGLLKKCIIPFLDMGGQS